MKFRKKPVVIDAIQWNGIAFDLPLPKWLTKALVDQRVKRAEEHLKITTLEGVMVAAPNYWIIQGVQGELYPCKPDIFEQTYEAFVEEGVTS